MTIVKQFTIIPIEACRYFNPKQLYLLAGLYINAYPQRESNYMTTDTTISQLSELTGVSTDYIKDSFIPRLKELEDKGYRVETIQQQREIRRNIYYLPNPPKNFRIIWAELFSDSSLSPEEKGVMIGLYCLCVNKEFRVDLSDKAIYSHLDMAKNTYKKYRDLLIEKKVIWSSYDVPMALAWTEHMESKVLLYPHLGSTINAVYKYVLEDLQYTMDHTPRLRPNEMAHYGAVTAFSAEMLAAKIHLNQGNYGEVETLTDDIIGSKKFKLYDDYYNLFKIPGKVCDESLFECQCTDFGLGSGDMVDADNWFVFQGPANDGNISGWGFIGIYKDFRDWAAARGETIRATTSFLLAGTTTPSGDVIRELQNSTQTDCWNGKAYTPTDQLTPGRTKYGANNNVRIFRYADVLLMNAEAKVRLGKDGDAPLKLVRDRAKMSEIDNATVDQILDERRMELVCEWGERYNDLIRTGKAASVLGSKGWTEDKTYYPLPFDQVSNIPSLTNEPIDE